MYDEHAMKESRGASTLKLRTGELGGVRVTLLATVCLLAGVGIGSVWFYQTTGRPAAKPGDETAAQRLASLSAGTKAVLQHLNSTVEIRSYALLDQASAPDSLRAFATRVDELLDAYQQEANGKINVVRHNSRSDLKAARAAAAADGIKPFPLGQGDPSYLGLVVVHHGQKEVLAQLAVEWEQALESDLSRAIAHVINAPSQTEGAVAAAQLDPAVAAEVRRQIPNFASVSVEEGTRILRESALKDFKAMAGEMETQIKEAEQRVSDAQRGKSEAELQAALTQLQKIRADHAEKLRQVTAKSSVQIEALRRLIEAGR